MFKYINLQLFAEVQTTLLPALSAEMKTFYDMTLIDEAAPALVHDQFGQKRPIPKNGGKVIEFRKFAPLAKALTPLTEGVTPQGKSLADVGVTPDIVVPVENDKVKLDPFQDTQVLAAIEALRS